MMPLMFSNVCQRSNPASGAHPISLCHVGAMSLQLSYVRLHPNILWKCRSDQRHTLVPVEGKALADLFGVGLRVVVGPHHIGDHLIANYHIPVTGRSLPAADGGESRVTKELCIPCFTGEVAPSSITMSSLSASTVPSKVACMASVSRVE